MNRKFEANADAQPWESTASPVPMMPRATASAAMVNRTHRIVRERAATMQAQKSRIRSLLIPLIVSAGFLLSIVCAAWVMLDEYDAAPLGLPEPGQQLFVFTLWCLPISAAALAVVAFRRAGSRTDRGGRR